ncbi:hypothetical protein [Schleiferilactobacillus harbinensis]|uniref:hypothetical protein n=1 Tax=Schleiferilactobacillus harbinensis TaxID=304207 RepID=UPI0039E9573E
MNEEERKALKDFDELTHEPNGSMQEYINLHRYYCRKVAIEAQVKCLNLLIDNYYDSPRDDMYRFLDKLYENRDLTMEENK